MYIPRRNVLQNSIFDMFRAGASGAPQQPVQQQPVQQQQVADPNAPPQNGTQAVPQTTPQQVPGATGDDANKSPLAGFETLWDNTPAKEGEQIEPDWNDHNNLVPGIKIDPKKLMEAARRIDFSKVIDPALVQKALKEGDVNAFNQVLNSALQAAFANQSMSFTRIAESMNRQFAERLVTKALPHHLRNHSVSTQIDNDNPVFQNPAVAPMLEMVKQQFQMKHPKASPAEISQKAKAYLGGFADIIKGGATPAAGGKDTKRNAAGAVEDWLDFAGVDGSKQ